MGKLEGTTIVVPERPNGYLTLGDRESFPVYWNRLDNSVWWMDFNTPTISVNTMNEFNSFGWEFTPVGEPPRGDGSFEVHKPEHYNYSGIECIDAIKASLGPEGFAAYCKGNVEKYVWRYKYKGGIQDLYKATEYLKWLVETEEEIEKG